MSGARERLERHQIPVYLFAAALAALAAWRAPSASGLAPAIEPALALVLYATFLQVPLRGLWGMFRRPQAWPREQAGTDPGGHHQAGTWGRFLAALLAANFIAVPVLVAALSLLLPDQPMIRLGVLLVLLAPCIDYVVTFAQLGRADARALLAATPVLLGVQMVLLPVYLGLFLGADAAQWIRWGPFLEAFVWLILAPLLLAALTQRWAGARRMAILGLLPVPATALVIFLVIASMAGQLGGPAMRPVLGVIPVYLGYAALAPLLGWRVARLFRLPAAQGRAVAFSAGTRNSLVILPLALAVPGAMPLLPAVIVAQTLVELLSELVYVRWIAVLPPTSASCRSSARKPN